MKVPVSLVCLLVSVQMAAGARILCMFGFSSQSHNNVFSALTTELARRGHEITVVTPYPVKHPPGKYRQIDVPEIRNKIEAMDTMNTKDIIHKFEVAWNMTSLCFNIILKMPEIKDLLNHKFDLIIHSIIFNECTIPFAFHSKAPLIMISPSSSLVWSVEVMGNPEPSSYIPNISVPYSDHMDFWQRAVNAMIVNFGYVMRTLVHLPRMNAAAREFFGADIPSIQELERNASVAFLNNHVSLNYPRPLLPGVVEVGGMHVKQSTNPLPQDIQDFLDGATEGAIYFSLGSIVRSDHLPLEKLQAIIEVFSALPQRVLWKWNLDSLPGQPSNVKLGKWLPQQDILAHPNVRLFMTQGGLMSTQEAAYHGVPLVGIPVLGDQWLNMKRNEMLGFAVTLDLQTFTNETLAAAIHQVLHTPSYTEVAQNLKQRVRDQPQSPLHRAVFWTEYVLRHNGAHHLRSAATQLSWYQLYLLDVTAAILVVLIILIILMKMVLKACFVLGSAKVESDAMKIKIKKSK